MNVVNIITIDRATIIEMNRVIECFEKRGAKVTGFEVSVGKTVKTAGGRVLENDYLKPLYIDFVFTSDERTEEIE